MFGLSFWEIAIILVVALIILGPKKLPELARSLGKGIREFRKATDDFKSTMDYEVSKPDDAAKRLAAQVDDAEILPDESDADAKLAQEAAQEAKRAIEQAHAETIPADVAAVAPAAAVAGTPAVQPAAAAGTAAAEPAPTEQTSSKPTAAES